MDQREQLEPRLTLRARVVRSRSSASSEVLTDGATNGLGHCDALLGGAEEEIALEFGVQANGLDGGGG